MGSWLDFEKLKPTQEPATVAMCRPTGRGVKILVEIGIQLLNPKKVFGSIYSVEFPPISY